MCQILLKILQYWSCQNSIKIVKKTVNKTSENAANRKSDQTEPKINSSVTWFKYNKTELMNHWKISQKKSATKNYVNHSNQQKRINNSLKLWIFDVKLLTISINKNAQNHNIEYELESKHIEPTTLISKWIIDGVRT